MAPNTFASVYGARELHGVKLEIKQHCLMLERKKLRDYNVVPDTETALHWSHYLRYNRNQTAQEGECSSA